MSGTRSVLGVVLAAGRGKRLGPLTSHGSKAMVRIAGQPMIARVMDMLIDGGCNRLVVVVHPRDAPLIGLLRGDPWASRVRLAFQERRLGMADAVMCAAPAIREDGASEFVLGSCDNVYPRGHVSALRERRRDAGLDAALTLMRVTADQIPTLAVVSMRDGLVDAIVEKPRPEDAPSDLGVPSLYALSVQILDLLPGVPVSNRGEKEFPDALRLLIEAGGRVGGLVVERRLTLTRPLDLLPLSQLYLHSDPSCAVIARELPDGVAIVPPVRIETEVELGPECTIGPDTVLESGCRVGRGAVVRRAVVHGGTTVEPGAMIEDAVLF